MHSNPAIKATKGTSTEAPTGEPSPAAAETFLGVPIRSTIGGGERIVRPNRRGERGDERQGRRTETRVAGVEEENEAALMAFIF